MFSLWKTKEEKEEVRKWWITLIEKSYPLDSKNDDTRRIAENMLIDIIKNKNFDWRELPISILEHYVDACELKKKLEKEVHSMNSLYEN